VFGGLYCEIDCNQDHDTVVNDIARIIKLKGKSNASRRPPRVLIVGAPGSGKSTLGELIASKFNLVYVSTANLLNSQIACKTEIGNTVAELMREGELITDNVIVDLIKERLNQQDCRVNGWVLEGFPKTESQMNMLKTMKIPVSLVVVLQIDDDIVYERHEYKKIDPVTGKVYDLKGMEELDEEVLERLVTKDSDKHEIVKKRLRVWKEFLPKLEETFKEHRLSLNADRTIESLAESISEAIENSID